MPTKEDGRERILEKALHNQLERILIEQVKWKKSRDHAAFDAFDKLEKKGCDPVFLVKMLSIIAEACRHDTWKGLTGFGNPDTLRTALKRLRVCADDVEKILGAVTGRALLQKPNEHALPADLRNLANRLEEIVGFIKPNRNLTGRAARGSIVRHVKDRTGAPHDRLVAQILNPTLRCDESLQNQWRQDNAAVITAIRRT
jgi:hypothetical protein